MSNHVLPKVICGHIALKSMEIYTRAHSWLFVSVVILASKWRIVIMALFETNSFSLKKPTQTPKIEQNITSLLLSLFESEKCWLFYHFCWQIRRIWPDSNSKYYRFCAEIYCISDNEIFRDLQGFVGVLWKKPLGCRLVQKLVLFAGNPRIETVIKHCAEKCVGKEHPTRRNFPQWWNRNYREWK